MEYDTNYVALLVAVVASVILGMLWYGPLFGKAWMRSIGKTKEDFTDPKGMQKGMVVSIIGAFIMAWVFSHVLQAFHPEFAVGDALKTAFFMWLGFVAPVVAGGTYYDGRKMDYFWVNGGYRLAELLAFGLVMVWLL